MSATVKDSSHWLFAELAQPIREDISKDFETIGISPPSGGESLESLANRYGERVAKLILDAAIAEIRNQVH